MKPTLPLGLYKALLASFSAVLLSSTLASGADYAPGSGALTLVDGDRIWNDSGSAATQTGAIQWNGGWLTVGGSSDETIAPSLSGGGSLIKEGTGSVIVTGQNRYTGGTFVKEGTLVLQSGGAGGAISGSVVVSGGATLKLNAGDATGYNGGTNALTKITLLEGATLQVADGANQTFGSVNLILQGATITGGSGKNIDLYGGGSIINSLASDTTSVVDVVLSLRQAETKFVVQRGTTADGVDIRFLQGIGAKTADGGACAFTKSGAGVMEFVVANSYETQTKISGGALRLNFNYAGAATSNILSVNSAILMDGGRLEIFGKDGAASSQELKGITTSASTHSLLRFKAGVGGTLTVDLGKTTAPSFGANSMLLLDVGADVTLSSTQSGWDNSDFAIWLDRAGQSFHTVSQTGTSLSAGAALATMLTSGGDTSTNYQLIGSGATTGALSAKSLFVLSTADGQSLDLGGALTLTTAGGLFIVNDHAYSLTGTGAVTSGPFIKSGSGLLTLSASLGTGNYGQRLEIQEGSLDYRATANNTLSGGFVNNGAFFYNGGATLTISGAAGESGGDFVVNSGNVYFTGALAGNSGMSGNFVVNNGAYLGVGAANQSGGGSSGSLGTGLITVNNGGTFGVNLAATTADNTLNVKNNFLLNAGATIKNVDGHAKFEGNMHINALGSSVNLVQYWNKEIVLSGIISGEGTINLNTIDSSDTGALYLFLRNNGNTFAGTYNINPTNAGSGELYTLVLGADNAGKLANFHLNTGKALLEVRAANAAITGLSGVAGSKVKADNNARQLTILGGGNFAGSFEGGFSWTKSGSDTLTLSGDSSSFTGGTKLTGGGLILDHANALGTAKKLTVSGTASLSDNANAVKDLILLNGTHLTTNFTLDAGESLTIGAPTSLPTLPTGSIATITGDLTLAGGTLNFDLSSTLLGSNDKLIVSGTLTLGANSSLNINPYEVLLEQGYYLLMQTGGINLGGFVFTTNLPSGGSVNYTVVQGDGIFGDVNNLYLSVQGSIKNFSWTAAEGTWSTSAQDPKVWLNTDSSLAADFENGSVVEFGTLSGVDSSSVTVNETVSVSKMTVKGETDYAFSGTGSMEVTSLVKEGNNTLVLGTANVITQATNISGGTIELAHTQGLGADGGVLLGSTGTLSINWGAGHVGTVNTNGFTGGLVLKSGTFGSTVENINNKSSLSFEGGILQLTNTGTVTKTVSGTEITPAWLNISGQTITFSQGSQLQGTVGVIGGSLWLNDTSFSGHLIKDGGTFYMKTNGGVDSLGTSGRLTLLNGAVLLLNWSDNAVNDVTSSRGLITLGNGARVDNVARGTSQYWHDFALATEADSWAYLNGNTNVGTTYQKGSISGVGNLQYGYNASESHYGMTWREGWMTNSYVGKTQLEATSYVIFELTQAPSSTNFTPFGAYDSSVAESATLRFLGANSATISGGTTGLVSSKIAGGFIMASGSTLKLENLGDTTIAGVLDVGTGTNTLQANTASVLLDSSLMNMGLKGSGRLNYASTVAGSTLKLTGTHDFTGTLGLSDNTNVEISTASTGLENMAGISAGANTQVKFSGESGDLAYAGVISGGASVQKEGAGSVTLSGANSYTGGTRVHAGSVVAASTNSLGSGDLTVTGGSLTVNASQSVGNTTITGGSVTVGASGNLGAADKTVTVDGGALTVASTVLGNGIIAKAGRIENFGSEGNPQSLILAKSALEKQVLEMSNSSLSVVDPASLNTVSLRLTSGTNLVVDEGITHQVYQENILSSSARGGAPMALVSIDAGASYTLTGTLTLNFASDFFDGWKKGDILSLKVFDANGLLNVDNVSTIVFNTLGAGDVETSFLTLDRINNLKSFEHLMGTGDLNVFFADLPPGGATDVIPEPSSATLSLLGLSALLLRRRRKVEA